jgi:hypothetical protein
MLDFYKKTIFFLFIMLLLSLLIVYAFFYQSKSQTLLLPAGESAIPWRPVVSSDMDDGARSHYTVNESSYNIDYDFWLDDKIQYPYVSFAVRFVQQEKDVLKHVDLSLYDTVKFKIKCNPANILMFTVYSFDDKVSSFGNLGIGAILKLTSKNWKHLNGGSG